MGRILRQKLPPDKRLDWRDPNMPVLAIARKANQPDAPMTLMEVKPELVQEFYAWSIRIPNPDKLYWADDPSYFWGKRNETK